MKAMAKGKFFQKGSARNLKPREECIGWRNPLEAWAQPYFDEAIVADRSIFGEIVTINDPDAIRRVLVNNTEDYNKDSSQRRLLGAAMREGILLVERRIAAGPGAYSLNSRQASP